MAGDWEIPQMLTVTNVCVSIRKATFLWENSKIHKPKNSQIQKFKDVFYFQLTHLDWMYLVEKEDGDEDERVELAK